MGVVNVTDPDGVRHVLEANPGDKLMEIIRDAGLPVEAICGGEGSCATCHVLVAPEWYVKLPPASEKESDFIQVAMTYEPDMSRLSCQIRYKDEFNGMEMLIPDEEY